MADKRTNIPHQPGAIAASTWSNPSGQKPQDLVDGYVVGKDNTTGQAIVTDGASQLKGITQGEVSIYQFAAFTRPESGEGGRLGRIQATGENFSAIDTPALTQNTTDAKAVQGCGTAFGSGQRDSPKPELTEEQLPEEPPEEPEPEEPPATTEEIANSNPYNPRPNPADEDTGTGCTTTSDCQWYDAISFDQPCPYGTTKQGATEITPGVFMILCCGEERPVGDGCPVDSSQLGWTCTNGTCTQTQGGQFATEEECLASGCLKQTWICTPNGCVELFDGSGEFDSLEECQLQCSGLGWDCVNGTCQQVSGGRFATQALCEASGCGAGSALSSTDYCTGDAGAVLTWSSGSVESFNPAISYSLTGTGSGSVVVDWGGGLIDTLEGDSFDSPIEINPTRITWDRLKNNCSASTDASLCVRINRTGVSFVGLQNNGSTAYSPRYLSRTGECLTGIDGVSSFNNAATNKWHMIFSSDSGNFGAIHTYLNESCTSQYANLFIYKTYFVQAYSGGVPSGSATREALSPPNVTYDPPLFSLSVSDQTGAIFSQSYSTEPTGFTYSCRN